MSDHPQPHDELGTIQLLLRQNQELLRQNAELLSKISQMLEKKEAVASPPTDPPTVEKDDDQEFYMGL